MQNYPADAKSIKHLERLYGPVVPNELVEDCAPFCQAPQCSYLISTQEAAVALRICCEDRHQLPADFHSADMPRPNAGVA